MTVFLSGIYSVYLSYMTLIGAGFYLIFRLLMDAEDFKSGVRKFFSGCVQMVLGIGMSLGVFLPMAASIMNSSRVSPGSGGILSLLKKCFKPYDFDYYNSLLTRPFSTNLQNLQVLGDTKYEGYKNYYEDPVLFCSVLAVIFLVQFVLVFWRSNEKKCVKRAVYGAAALILVVMLLPLGGIVFNAFTTPPTYRFTYILMAVFLLAFAWMWDYLQAGGRISIFGLAVVEILMLRAYMAGYEDSVFSAYRENAVILAVTGTVMVLGVLILGFCRKNKLRKAVSICLMVMLAVNVISEGGITYTDRICLKKQIHRWNRWQRRLECLRKNCSLKIRRQRQVLFFTGLRLIIGNSTARMCRMHWRILRRQIRNFTELRRIIQQEPFPWIPCTELSRNQYL